MCDVAAGCDAILSCLLSPTSVATQNEVCLEHLRPLGYPSALGSVVVDVGSGGVVDGLLDKVTVFVTTFNEACLLHGRPLVFETFMLPVFSHSVWAFLLIIAPFNVLVCWEIEASCALWPFFLFHFLHG